MSLELDSIGALIYVALALIGIFIALILYAETVSNATLPTILVGSSELATALLIIYAAQKFYQLVKLFRTVNHYYIHPKELQSIVEEYWGNDEEE